MKAMTSTFEVSTHGKGTYEITDQVESIVCRAKIQTGLVTVFIRHTSASLILYENADPSARTDLHAYFDKLVPENTGYFVHTLEGADDMPAHIRSVLTRSSEVIPVAEGTMQLGIWQGIFLFEHRHAPHRRQISVSVIGSLAGL